MALLPLLARCQNRQRIMCRTHSLLVKNPLLQDWIREGEPNTRVDEIYRLLEGKRDYDYRVDEKKDVWFSGFRDSGVELNIGEYY